MKVGVPGVAFAYEPVPVGGDAAGLDGGVRLAKIGGGVVTTLLTGEVICVICVIGGGRGVSTDAGGVGGGSGVGTGAGGGDANVRPFCKIVHNTPLPQDAVIDGLAGNAVG
jgi:hypothetical protein